ncbi:unnamed protein product [Ceratitis capitata]|uniref:(Mediterranean fruit fly) hypothetical protein n=1 Tax=Ceratitis capitata TaxID=7213 RepID=A0A811UGI4_CERCA|nr:unnamed protein product [Ceratitis capitata]
MQPRVSNVEWQHVASNKQITLVKRITSVDVSAGRPSIAVSNFSCMIVKPLLLIDSKSLLCDWGKKEYPNTLPTATNVVRADALKNCDAQYITEFSHTTIIAITTI